MTVPCRFERAGRFRWVGTQAGRAQAALETLFPILLQQPARWRPTGVTPHAPV